MSANSYIIMLHLFLFITLRERMLSSQEEKKHEIEREIDRCEYVSYSTLLYCTKI